MMEMTAVAEISGVDKKKINERTQNGKKGKKQ